VAPGRVDSPPTSTRSAPAAASARSTHFLSWVFKIARSADIVVRGVEIGAFRKRERIRRELPAIFDLTFPSGQGNGAHVSGKHCVTAQKIVEFPKGKEEDVVRILQHTAACKTMADGKSDASAPAVKERLFQPRTFTHLDRSMRAP